MNYDPYNVGYGPASGPQDDSTDDKISEWADCLMAGDMVTIDTGGFSMNVVYDISDVVALAMDAGHNAAEWEAHILGLVQNGTTLEEWLRKAAVKLITPHVVENRTIRKGCYP